MDYIKNITSRDYVLNNLTVEGEISNYNHHSNGRIYFSLKDDISKIDCLMFPEHVDQLKETFKLGDHVLVSGRVDLVEKDGKLSLQAKSIEKFGIGKIYERFEKLRAELYEKGYFDDRHKKALPKYPNKVGIITSPTGAAIRDILKIAKKNNPYIDIVLYPSNVQGSFATESMIKALDYFEESDVDLIILTRGGGAYEDLDSFNSEKLAMKVFKHDKPIVSAVGHAMDFVISDYVADARAATPTEVAEMIFFDINSYKNNIADLFSKITSSLNSNIRDYEKDLKLNKGLLALNSPENQIDNLLKSYKYKLNQSYNNINNRVFKERHSLGNYRYKLSPNNLIIKLNELSSYNNKIFDKIQNLSMDYYNKEKNKLTSYKTRLDRHNINQRLAEGYSILLDKNGHMINSIGQVDIDDRLELLMKDGSLDMLVETKKDR